MSAGGKKAGRRGKKGPGNSPDLKGEARVQVATIVGVDPTTISRATPRLDRPALPLAEPACEPSQGGGSQCRPGPEDAPWGFLANA